MIVIYKNYKHFKNNNKMTHNNNRMKIFNKVYSNFHKNSLIYSRKMHFIYLRVKILLLKINKLVQNLTL